MKGNQLMNKTIKKNFFKVPNRIFEYGLSPNAFLIYSEFVSQSEEFNPSVSYLCKKLKMSRATIHRSIQELLDRNFINCIEKGGLGRLSKYELVHPKYWRKND